MHFQTEEYYYKDSPWKKVWEVVSAFLLLFYVPIVYGKHLVKKMHGVVEPESRQQGEWLEHAEFQNLTIWSCALNDEAEKKIIESETLDFPSWKDMDDPFRCLLIFKTEPIMADIEGMYFDEVDLVTKNGIYLIRINEKGKGMSLCFLSGVEATFHEVTKLKPLSWIIDQIEDYAIQLTGYSDKGKYIIKVKTGHNNNNNSIKQLPHQQGCH